jgi:hypothetical protein
LFRAPRNIDELTVCPHHRSTLGVGWSRGSNTRCRVPKQFSGHKGKFPKANRGIGKHASQILLKQTGIFIQAGSGKYLKGNETGVVDSTPLPSAKKYIKNWNFLGKQARNLGNYFNK